MFLQAKQAKRIIINIKSLRRDGKHTHLSSLRIRYFLFLVALDLVGKILGPILGTIFGSVLLYFRNNTRRAVAEALVDRGEEIFGIKKYKWKYYPIFWELSLILSSMRCGFMECWCCCKNSNEQNGTYSEEPIETTTCIFDTDTDPLHETEDSEKHIETLTRIFDTDTDPLHETKDIKQSFKRMLEKLEKVTFSDFHLRFQKYANNWYPKGDTTHGFHCRHQGCRKENHSQFTNCMGCQDSILYYAVIDWNTFDPEKGLTEEGLHLFLIFNFLHRFYTTV